MKARREPFWIPRIIWIPWFVLSLAWFMVSLVMYGPSATGREHPDFGAAFVAQVAWVICSRWMR